ncbi:hypothetical protein DIT71_15400 [Marinobacter vulgaris]|uniref:MSHA biogenesis protein MshN n=1 Tax=Marinobacter vulgaris TaxID=1928331 RepID=A0A2V3ZV36_9GAMM|nr:hypothetical protein [Marinobacter vulgaris]PXX89287.1 hypothetical protein DIT71_15400 [Marinobacter vulgaris]TSJ68149.1 hypothetical protein FPC41_15785 [Marinobacter vulgaris]
MSLLNDALRAAEQRQDRPEQPAAYMGGQSSSRGSRPLLLIVVVLLALVIAFMGGYWMLTNSSSPQPMVVESEPSQDQRVQRTAAVVSDQQPEVAEPEPAQRPEPDPEPIIVAQVTTEPLPAPAEPKASEPESAALELEAEPAPVVAKAPAKQETRPAEAEKEDEKPEEVSTAGVKRVPETPAATDRSTARELERLVSAGNITSAERGLAALTQAQTAPRSRYVVARALLVDGKQDQALGWLPPEIAAAHPRLRLLRARALHANSDLAAAVDTLSSDVPPVQDHAEYRVTLATLLQQQGQNTEAARHWAELIAWDDSHAPWWVGLAISLEAQGEPARAARAYRQAAELPGLPRSLADYVRQRLQALRAG